MVILKTFQRAIDSRYQKGVQPKCKILTRNPLCGCDEQAKGHDECGCHTVVESVDGSLGLGLVELVLVHDGDVVPDGGEHPHDAGHLGVFGVPGSQIKGCP